MTFNIQDINSAISQSNGLLYASHFYVQITPPKCLQSGGQGDVIQSIPMFCDATTMPGLQFQPIDVKPQGYGLFESRPINVNFANQNFAFYCDGKGKLQQLFQKWSQNILNFNINQSNSKTVNGAAQGVFNYPDWYETTIEIFQYDATGQNVVNTWKLYNAYPLTINPVPISWDQPDMLLKLSVDFYYKAWGSEAITDGNSPGLESSVDYNQTRVDPSVSQALSSPEARNSAINGNFTPNSYAPLTTDSSTSAPAITGNAPGTIAGTGATPVFGIPGVGGTGNQTGFGTTLQTF